LGRSPLGCAWTPAQAFVVKGYGLSSIARPLVGVAFNWPMVLLSRSVDRIGKGVRGAS
jgi:hypothetical protein